MFTRRAFLLSSAAAAAAPAFPARAGATDPTVLRIERRVLEINGKAASVYGLRQPNGTPGLTMQAGAPFRVRVENRIDEPSLIHWHGLTPPWRQDGVPGLTGPAIPSKGSADYDFPLAFGGTYWMHGHYGFQEQALMTAPLIVRDATSRADEQEVVVLLSDFSFTPANEIYASLRKSGGMKMDHSGMDHMAGHDMDMGGMDMSNMDMSKMDMGGMDMSKMDMDHMNMGQMKMDGPDLNDVKYDAFLANDRTLADPEVVRVEAGGKVRLRLINGAGMTNFHVDLGQLDGRLIAVDGQAIQPLDGRRFPLACGQRIDILVQTPKEPTACPVLFVVEGEKRRTGVVLAPAAAKIARIAETGDEATAALDLGLERRLRAAAPLSPRKADRVYNVALTGAMAGYVWSLNDIVWNEQTPALPLVKGERVELAMTNRTMMSHPMHLHGHRFQVVEIDGQRFDGALRDTLLVPPHSKVVVAFDADNPGKWAFHCHLMYHMHAGMFATFDYS